MAKEINNSSNGIGFIGLLAIVFITLKLLNVIKWSWLWVLAPIWISIVFFAITVIIVLMIQGKE